MKTALFALALLSVAPAGAADQAQSIGARDCRAASLSDEAAHNVSWSGACKNGFAQGPGILKWTEKDDARPALFEGTLVDGRAHGDGYLKSASLSQYEGGFKDGMREGMGVELDLGGGRYDGNWYADHYHGTGSKVYTTGGRYDGQWQAGLRHGRGRATYLDGSVFEGEFREGLLAGEAALAKPDRSGKYTYKGSVRSPWMTNLPYPGELAYAQLSKGQQALIREDFLLVHADDEPPFPLRGIGAVWATAASLQRKVLTTGVLRMNVLVDSDGNASSVQVYASPSPDVTKVGTFVVMKEKYKPAKCAGKPCAMVYPYAFYFIVDD